MNLKRISAGPWPTRFGVLMSLFCLVSRVNAFLKQPLPLQAPSRISGVSDLTTTLLASKPQHKHRPSDQYSSTTLSQSNVASQISSLYSDGHSYRKTIRKTKKVEGTTEPSATTSQKATIPPNKFLNELNRYPSLILNADYQPMSYLPLSVCHWQEAVKLIFSGKVAVVDVYEGVSIRAANLEVPLPAVVALNEYVPQCSHKPAFTRRNVFLRDEYTCQYCSNRFHNSDLSIDHVLPRSMGGRLNWENAVTSCLKCNGRKGNMLVSDLKSVGMKLQNKPRAPTRHELAMKAGKMLPRKVHPTWKPYLTSVFGDDDVEDVNHPTPNLEALGIREPADKAQRPKAMSKNKRKKYKRKAKQEQQQVQQ